MPELSQNAKIGLVVAAGALAAGALFLLTKPTAATASAGAKPVDEYTKAEILQLLDEILAEQKSMHDKLADLQKRMAQKSGVNFDQMYNEITPLLPKPDVFERHGLQYSDLDRMLERFAADAEVNQRLTMMMSGAKRESSEKAKEMSVATVVAIHGFMLDELKKLKDEFTAKPNQSSYNSKTTSVAMQALMALKVQEKYGYVTEDLEEAVLLNYAALQQNQEFHQLNMRIQDVVSSIQ